MIVLIVDRDFCGLNIIQRKSLSNKIEFLRCLIDLKKSLNEKEKDRLSWTLSVIDDLIREISGELPGKK